MLPTHFGQNRKPIEVPGPAPVKVVNTQLGTIKRPDISFSWLWFASSPFCCGVSLTSRAQVVLLVFVHSGVLNSRVWFCFWYTAAIKLYIESLLLYLLWDVVFSAKSSDTLTSPVCEHHNSGPTNCANRPLVIGCVSVHWQTESEVWWIAMKWRAENCTKDPCCPCLQSGRDDESELEISENNHQMELGPHKPGYWVSTWSCVCERAM